MKMCSFVLFNCHSPYHSKELWPCAWRWEILCSLQWRFEKIPRIARISSHIYKTQSITGLFRRKHWTYNSNTRWSTKLERYALDWEHNKQNVSVIKLFLRIGVNSFLHFLLQITRMDENSVSRRWLGNASCKEFPNQHEHTGTRSFKEWLSNSRDFKSIYQQNWIEIDARSLHLDLLSSWLNHCQCFE